MKRFKSSVVYVGIYVPSVLHVMYITDMKT